MQDIVTAFCEAGKIANQICHDWTGGTEDVSTRGTGFIFFYEVAKAIHEARVELGVVHLGFDLALSDLGAFGSGRPPGRVSRNTKRKYMVLQHAEGAQSIIRAQQYYDMGLVTSEAKGLARALRAGSESS